MENKNPTEITDVTPENTQEVSSSSTNETDNRVNASQEVNWTRSDPNEPDEGPENLQLNTADSSGLGTYTIREILNEFMDFSIVGNPGSTSVEKEKCYESQSNKRLLQIFPPGQSQAGVCSVKEIIDRILNYTVCSSSDLTGLNNNQEEEMISHNSEAVCPDHLVTKEIQSELGLVPNEFQMFRALKTHMIKSESAMYVANHEKPTTSPSSRSIGYLLPSYSTVLKLGPPLHPPRFLRCIESSLSFIPRQPPPSYAEVEGIWEDLQSMISSESVIFGPDPIYIVCPVCRRVVITHTNQERSPLTHLAAIFMCVCLCWPCCLLPYCLRTCNYTYHFCPHCHYYFGMHRPF